MITKLAAARAKRHKTHDVVEVAPTEKFHRDPAWRGTKHDCLCLLGGNPEGKQAQPLPKATVSNVALKT